MTSDRRDLDDVMREVVEHYTPDPERRRAILLRLRVLELAHDPEVAAAQEAFGTASPAEIDAAFELAIQTSLIEPAAHADGTFAARLTDLVRALRAGAASAPLRELFVLPMSTTAGVRGPDDEGKEPESAEHPTEVMFVVPAALATAAGLHALGRTEMGDGELRIVLRRRAGTVLPPLAVVVEAGDYVSLSAMLVALEETAEATVDWLTPDAPETIRLGLVDDRGPS